MKRFLVPASVVVATVATGLHLVERQGSRADAAAPLRFELPPVIGGLDAPLPALGDAAAAPDLDTSYLWAAYEAGDYAAVRAEIAVLARLHPAWRPPADLVRLTDAAEIRRVVLPALAEGRAPEAVRHYLEHPERFACADVTIEALWAVAEAFGEIERPDDAFAVYDRVLGECDDANLRLSTLEKALAWQDQARFAALIAVEEERVHEEADAARLARIRRDAFGDAAPAPAGPVEMSRFDRTLRAIGARTASPEDVAWLEGETRRARSSNAAMVLGYWRLDAGEPARAVEWFRTALGWRRNVKAAEGLFHAYGRLGETGEQARIVAAYPEIRAAVGQAGAGPDPLLARAWTAIEEGDTRTALALADAAQSAPPAERELARGWAMMGAEDPRAAAAAFGRAAVAAGDPATAASAAKGKALAAVAAGDPADADLTALAPADREDVERAMLERQIAEVFDRGDFRQARALLTERARRFPAAGPLGMLEGWILFRAGDEGAAAAYFREAYVRTRSDEARHALLTVQRAMFREF